MSEPLSATEALARGKTNALRYVYHKINDSASSGCIMMPIHYAPAIAAYVKADLVSQGYVVEDTPDGARISWTDLGEGV